MTVMKQNMKETKKTRWKMAVLVLALAAGLRLTGCLGSDDGGGGSSGGGSVIPFHWQGRYEGRGSIYNGLYVIVRENSALWYFFDSIQNGTETNLSIEEGENNGRYVWVYILQNGRRIGIFYGDEDIHRMVIGKKEVDLEIESFINYSHSFTQIPNTSSFQTNVNFWGSMLR